MKIAFCLHGISSGKNFKDGGLPVAFQEESLLYHKHIIDKYDADCFYHTWNSEFTEEIFSIYKPKKHVVENYKEFEKPGIRSYIEYLRYRIRGISDFKRRNNMMSRWYSFHQAIRQVIEYEKEHNIKYDYIFITRFDMSLFADVIFEKFNKDNFYCGDWYRFFDKNGNQINEQNLFNNKDKFTKKVQGFPENKNGLSDFWFCASPSIMDEFSTIFNEIDVLIKESELSNHLVALEKLKKMNKLNNIEKILEFGKDYYLSRWI